MAFLTLKAMDNLCRQFAQENPMASYSVVGYSRLGTPIYLLSIKGMPESSLFLGFVHPNEPLMSLVLPSLLKMAQERQQNDAKGIWLLVPIWDVDGAEFNHEWWVNSLSFLDTEFFVSNFFRPSPKWQVEWTFPIQYNHYEFCLPLAETQAVMAIIDQYNPEYLFSVHNALFPEGYILLHDLLASRAPSLSQLLREHSGTRQFNPIPYVEEWAPSIYGLPYLSRELDFFFSQSIPVPIDYGGASFDYAHAKAVVAELPLLQWPQNPARWADRAKERLAVLWTEFYNILEMLFTTVGIKTDDDVPILVSNAYYLLERSPWDLSRKQSRLADSNSLQHGKDYLEGLLTMTTYLMLLYRQYPHLPPSYKPFLHELLSIAPQLPLANLNRTQECYVQIVRTILNGRAH